MSGFPVFTISVILSASFLLPVYADTLSLKNGRKAEGLISGEDKDTLWLNVGSGIVVFRKNEIASIYKSTPDETKKIKDKWEKDKLRLEQVDIFAREQKAKSWQEWEAKDAQREAENKLIEAEKRKIDANSKLVNLTTDDSGNYLMVDVVLDGNVPATLIIDTGCPTVLLTASKAEELGFDLAKINKVSETMVLNGRHKIGQILLESIKLGEVEEKDIEAEILLDYDEELEQACKDGLLGLSLLKRFHFALDQKNKKLILRKEEEQMKGDKDAKE